jgi:hypothetical protein
MLLKVVLFAYSQGIVSSRSIERARHNHVTSIALSGDCAPHFTTKPRRSRTGWPGTRIALARAARSARATARTTTCASVMSTSPPSSDIHKDKRGYVGERFRGSDKDCQQCLQRFQCLRNPHQPAARQVTFFQGPLTICPF